MLLQYAITIKSLNIYNKYYNIYIYIYIYISMLINHGITINNSSYLM